MLRRCFILGLLFAAVPCLARPGVGNECTPAGVWYGGSVTAYQMTIIPSLPGGTYTVFFDGVYKAVPINSKVTATMTKNARAWEGSMLSLTGDASFVDQPPATNGKMPDLLVGWFKIEMLDCNTIKNTIPFLGVYFGPPSPISFFGAGIWEPGSPWTGVNWVTDPAAKVPLVSPPDVDMIPVLTLGETKPIVETYRRLGTTIDPTLLHSE